MNPRYLQYETEGALRAAFVAEAKSLVNAPYLHRGRSRELGLDCLGVPHASAVALGMHVSDAEYDFVPRGTLLDDLLDENMVRLADWRLALPGDVVTRAYRLHKGAKHCGVVTANSPEEGLRCVHASRLDGRVVEGRWTEPHFNRFAYRAREVDALVRGAA